jgi:hypothetical protein
MIFFNNYLNDYEKICCHRKEKIILSEVEGTIFSFVGWGSFDGLRMVSLSNHCPTELLG